ncbi:MAG: DUF3552 domain-containing protein, partial [Chloroflexi bacterium]
MNNPIFIIVSVFVALLMCGAGVAAGYYYNRSQTEKKRLEEHSKAKTILQEATDKASKVELDARDRALKIVQNAENDLNQRRNELNREVERLDRRRAEVDGRVEKIELREQNLNKRQSTVDRRANDIEKVHEQQIEKLRQIAE